MAAKVEAFPEGTRRKLTRPRDQFPGGRNLYSASTLLLTHYLFFSNSFITALSRLPLSYLIISFPRFLQLQFVLRPASTRFRYQGYRDFAPRLPISMLADYDLFARSLFLLGIVFRLSLEIRSIFERIIHVEHSS